MPNDGRKQNNTNFLTKAAVGVAIGAVAAVGGYFFGKVAAEEEAKESQHQHQRANTSSHASRSQEHTHQARQRVTDGDDLKKSALENYGDVRACGICFRDFEEVKRNDEAIHTTPCGHIYCNECLQESLNRNPVCPSCRFTVLPTQTLRVYL